MVPSLGHPQNHVRDYAGIANAIQVPGLITDVKTIGDRIRWAREKRELTQAALGKLAGVGQSTIASAEKAHRNKPRELVSIAVALRANPVWLDTGDGDWESTVTAAPPPLEAVPPEYKQLLLDLQSIPPRKRSLLLDQIHQAAEEAREAAEHLAGHKEVAHARRGAAKARASAGRLGDGNVLQSALDLPLATVRDPFSAAPSAREQSFYRKVEQAPK